MKDEQVESPYLLVGEAAEIARTFTKTAQYWCSNGKLKSTRPGRRLLILRSDLMAFLAEEEQTSDHSTKAEAGSTPRYLLIEEVAKIARTTPSTVRYWLQIGKLKSTKPGRRRLIVESDLIAFLSGATH